MSNFKVLFQTEWQLMFGMDEQTHPGFVDSQDLPRALVLLVGRLVLRPGGFRKPTRWDFTRAVTLGWLTVPKSYLRR